MAKRVYAGKRRKVALEGLATRNWHGRAGLAQLIVKISFEQT